MMFMIPTPPTSSEMPTMPVAIIVTIAATLVELLDHALRGLHFEVVLLARLEPALLPQVELDLRLGVFGQLRRFARGDHRHTTASDRALTE